MGLWILVSTEARYGNDQPKYLAKHPRSQVVLRDVSGDQQPASSQQEIIAEPNVKVEVEYHLYSP